MRAERISEYNAESITRDLSAAKRQRIVTINADVLSSEQEITLTLFDDVEPIRLKPTRVVKADGAVHWAGTTPDGSQVFLSALAWDVDSDGLASPSNQNRRSPWRINERGVPELDDTGGPMTAGPPPQTPEQIANVMRSQSLERQAFYSLFAVLTHGGKRYVIQPLTSTPRYAAIYEDGLQGRETSPRDRMPHETDDRTEADKRAALQRHAAVSRSLEAATPIRGDIE